MYVYTSVIFQLFIIDDEPTQKRNFSGMRSRKLICYDGPNYFRQVDGLREHGKWSAEKNIYKREKPGRENPQENETLLAV